MTKNHGPGIHVKDKRRIKSYASRLPSYERELCSKYLNVEHIVERDKGGGGGREGGFAERISRKLNRARGGRERRIRGTSCKRKGAYWSSVESADRLAPYYSVSLSLSLSSFLPFFLSLRIENYHWPTEWRDPLSRDGKI